MHICIYVHVLLILLQSLFIRREGLVGSQVTALGCVWVLEECEPTYHQTRGHSVGFGFEPLDKRGAAAFL